MSAGSVCPDHHLDADRVCPSCVRPLCRKCQTAGPMGKCLDCSQASLKPGDYAPGRREGVSPVGPLVFFALLAVAWWFSTQQGCAYHQLPFGLQWQH